MKNLAALRKEEERKKREISMPKHLTVSDRSVSLSRISMLRNFHASQKRKPTNNSFKN